MRWMWDYETQVMDEKGKMVKGTALSLEPVEDGKVHGEWPEVPML